MAGVPPEASDDNPLPGVKLAEVARVAGVSVSTVSKVLNGRSGVSTTTRNRIAELLGEHHYRRRNSSRPTSPLIEVVCYDLDSAWALEVVVSLERVARESGLGMVLTSTDDRMSPGREWLDAVLQRQSVGVILVIADLPAGQKEQLRARGIPIVMVDPVGGEAPDMPSVGSANWMGGFAATNHLIELGHRRIAIVGGPEGVMAATARLSGYRAALSGAGIAERPEYIRPGEFHHSDGMSQGTELLTMDDRPTAIFASSDLQALGVYEAARSLHLSIPRDLSVVGYDDLKIAQWTGPALTTVRQPLSEMAEEAGRLVMRLRSDPQLSSTHIELANRLVVRDSTAAPIR
jgi:LacI family xylobiose transport system transcriptional regulator